MEQYYISQAQQQPTPTPPVRNVLTSAPVVWTILTTSLLSIALGALLNHLFTKSRDKAKVRAEVMKEFEVKYMTVNLVDALKDVNENIRKVGERVEEVNTNLSQKMDEGFKQVNDRIDNLIQGTEDQGKA